MMIINNKKRRMSFLESFNKSKTIPVQNKRRNEKIVKPAGKSLVVSFSKSNNNFTTFSQPASSRKNTKNMSEFEKEYQDFIERLRQQKDEEN